MRLEDFKPSILSLPILEARAIHQLVRNNRMKPIEKPKRKTKLSQPKARKSKLDKFLATQDLNELQKLLEIVEGKKR